MTEEQLAQAIAKGLIETGVEGPFDAVSCSTAGDYPSGGVSQWEGPRFDYLMGWIDGGDRFAIRTYSDIRDSGELDALKELLGSEQGQAAQLAVLAEDCLNLYLPALSEIPKLTDFACIIYAGIWCPTSHDVVRRFLTRLAESGYDINDVGVLLDLFYDQYTDAASVGEIYREGYQNRAVNTYNYVVGLELI